MSFLVISSSLHPESKSRILAQKACLHIEALDGKKPDYMDLRDTGLPFCDGASAYGAPALPELNARVEAAKGIFITTPIYCFDVNSSLRNFIEMTGQTWKKEQKIVAIAVAAGGGLSYMAPMTFINSLMLDFRSLVLPNYVFATGKDFDGQGEPSLEISKRLRILSENLHEVTCKLR